MNSRELPDSNRPGERLPNLPTMFGGFYEQIKSTTVWSSVLSSAIRFDAEVSTKGRGIFLGSPDIVSCEGGDQGNSTRVSTMLTLEVDDRLK